MNNPIEDILAQLSGSDDSECSCGNCKDPADLTPEEADRLINLGSNPNDLKVGDFVVRSDEGRNHVKFPDDNYPNQKARIAQINTSFGIDEDGHVYNAFITVALAPNTLRTFPAYLPDYKKA